MKSVPSLSGTFYFYFLSRSTMVFANITYVMIITFYIYEKTGSAAFAALFPLLNTVGSLLAGFISPLVVERIGNKHTMRWLPLANAVLVTVFVLFFEVLSSITFSVFLLIFVKAMLSGIVNPLYHSTVPM